MTKLLLVDDDMTYRTLLEDALRRAGFEVIAVGSTMQALSVFEDDPDIRHVVVDLRMPLNNPNGLSFARMAKHKRTGTEVVLFSGTPALLSPELLTTVETQQFGDVLGKDDGIPVLVAKIRQRFGPVSRGEERPD